MGSKQTAQSNTSSTYSPPPEVLANYKDVTNQAKGVAATPYTGYSGPLVAGINNQQSTGIGAVNNASGIQNPYNAGSAGLAGASASNIDPTQYSASQLSQYENPYQNDVIKATEAEINQQNAQQAASLQGNSIASGAFGGDRAGVAQAALAGQQDIANNATLAGLNSQNFLNAQSEFNNQQGVGLGAAQNTAARQLAASQQFGNLGNTAQTEALAEANAQTNAGTLQQTTQQAQDKAAYNQFLQQQAYPFQTTGWLANIVEGIGSQSGGTSTGQTTQQGGNGVSQVAGGLLGLASFLKRGGRVTPRKAGGGGLVSPYAGILDPTTGQPVGLGGGSFVPTSSLPIGHTMPTGQQPAMAAAPDQAQQMTQAAKSVQGLGNSGFGDHLSDAMQDFGDNFSSGGLGAALGGLFARGGQVPKHYDGGGTVDDLLTPPSLDPDVSPAARSEALKGAFGVPPPVVPSPAPVAPSTRSLGAYRTAGNAYAGGDDTDAKIAGLNPHFGDHLQDLIQDAHDDYGANVGINNGYRDVATQNTLWQAALAKYGDPSIARLHVAPPGLSNHNRGLAADLTYGDPNAAGLVHSMAPDYGLNFPMSYENWHIEPNGIRGGTSVANSEPASASAYGGNSPAPVAPAAAAIDGASTPTGLASPNAADLPVQGGADAQAAPDKSGLFGLNFDPATRQGLLAAGLGMLGGTSMSAFANIGEGGLKGLGAYNNARTLQAEIDLHRAQAEKAMVETGLLPASTAAEIGLKGAQRGQFLATTQGADIENKIKQQRLNLMMDILGGHESAGNKKADAIAANPGATNPAIASPTVAPKAPSASTAAPAAPTAPPARPKQVAPGYDPDQLNAQADKLAMAGMDEAAKIKKDQAAAILSGNQTVHFTDGSVGYYPGASEAKAKQAGLVSGAQESAKSPYDLVEVQPTPGGPTYKVPKSQLLTGAGSPPGSALDAAATINPSIAKQPEFYADKQKAIAGDEHEMVQQYQARQLSRQRLQTLAGILQNYQPGAFAQEKADLVASLRGVGIPVPSTATSDPAAFQEFVKNATANVFNEVKGMGGRVLVSEIDGLTKANANPELQPAAAAAIIGQTIGILDYEDKHTQDYFDWKKQNPNAVNTSDFELPWAKSHPVSQYVQNATKGIAYRGQDIPSADKRTSGQTYLTPKGPMTWVGNGWRPAAQ